MTFKELQDEVLDFCQEIQSRPDFNITRVKRAINRGYYDFAGKTSCLQSEFELTTAVNQESYAINDEIIDFYHVRYIIDATNEYGKPLTPYPGGYAGLPKNKSFGEPSEYWFRGLDTRVKCEIGFYPIPDAVETIKGWCLCLPGGSSAPELSSNSDKPLIRDAWQDALVNYAVWKLHATYSHLNKAWRAKALEFKGFYDENVESHRFSNFFKGEITQVQDVYETY
jgi:hypothetical protein